MEQPQGFAVRDTRSPAPSSQTPNHLLPLAALMLAGSLGVATPAQAQSEEKTLKTVTVTDTQDPNLSKENCFVFTGDPGAVPGGRCGHRRCVLYPSRSVALDDYRKARQSLNALAQPEAVLQPDRR